MFSVLLAWKKSQVARDLRRHGAYKCDATSRLLSTREDLLLMWRESNEWEQGGMHGKLR